MSDSKSVSRSTKRALDSHFLQSLDWGRFQRSLGRRVFRESGSGWRVQSILERGRLTSRLYAPYGPIVDSGEALATALEALIARARRHGASFVRVEPIGAVDESVLGAARFRRVRPMQPESTGRVDLRATGSDLVARLGKHDAALDVRRSHDPDDIEVLIRLLARASARTGVRPHDPDYLRAQAHSLVTTDDAALYIVHAHRAIPAAAALVFDDAHRRYCVHAASDHNYRALDPAGALLKQLIIDARQHGQREFDFYGIAEPGEPGVRFDTRVNAREHTFAGTWEAAIDPTRYLAYRAARFVFG